MNQKAVVLLSGGLDSATTLAIARSQQLDTYALSILYGQRSQAEIDCAAKVARHLGAVEHKVLQLDLGLIGGSALTDHSIDIPETGVQPGIPVTYVPARNTLFLSLALGWAEVLEARHIFVGVNAVDYSGYPDCRPAFIDAFQQLAQVATKQGIEGPGFQVQAPLLHLTKADIIRLGLSLGVDYSLTLSCYQADAAGRACGKCDSCRLRQQGFRDAQVADPTIYQKN